MISYYKSKHPGIFLYITLVCVSVFAFLFLNINAFYSGILSILWGIFIFMRTLSLYEVEEHAQPLSDNLGTSKTSNHNKSTLAHDLLKKMSNKSHLSRGIMAMTSLNIRTILWFIIAIIYIANYIIKSHDSSPPEILVQNISNFFIIGAAFWAGQTYAYSNQASKLMLVIFGLIFCITALKININLDINSLALLDISMTSKTILYALIIYSAAIFLYPFTKGSTYGINAITGLFVIILISVCSINTEITSQYIALWLIGWSIISIFWVRSYSNLRKKYVLYQCE